ncbi:MAG: hypothetical protein JWR63_927 [Conexibacter sp.]|nr:hypothetical protein [Conexibacter sp.]
MIRRRRSLVAILALVLLALAPGAADAKKAKKSRCAAGKVPVVKGSGKHARLAYDGKGRLKCTAPKRIPAKAIPAPRATPGGQLGATADQLENVLDVVPGALARLDRKIGARRTSKMVAIALGSWRNRAVAADAKADTYSPGTGVDVDFKSDFGAVDDGSQTGYAGKATIEGSFTRGGLDQLIKGKAGVELPAEVKDGRIKVELAFTDLPNNCPDATGKVKGVLKAGGKLTLTVGSTVVTLSAKIDATYNLAVGDDARWHTIDDVDVQTEFQVGGTGRSTETWRGRRLGAGFGTEGILGAKDTGAALVRDLGRLDNGHGGIFGPHVGVNFERDGGSLWDLRSIDNVKGMIATNVASMIATLAVVEYVRKVAADRVQKVWYDQEKCLKIDAAPAKAKLRAGETTTVTARNARAASGAPASANLTATGTKSLEPGSAPLPANGTKDFTLTAPAAKPAKSSWKLVALSKAGKKTAAGDLTEDQGPYTVTLDDHETGHFATHDATGHLTGTLQTAAVAGATPERWTASAPVSWTDLTATPKLDCSYVDPQSGGAWTATVTAVADDRIRVELDFTAQTLVTWTVACPEGGSIPGQAGTSPMGMTPRTFELPAGGGTQAVGGSITLGTDGFFTDGTVTVTPSG